MAEIGKEGERIKLKPRPIRQPTPTPEPVKT